MNVSAHASEKNPKVAILVLSGRLDTMTSPATLSKLAESLDQSGAGVILDLAGVDFLSSSGLGVLIQLRKKAKADNKNMAVVRPIPAIYKLFKLTAMEKTLNCFEDEDEAIQALWPTT